MQNNTTAATREALLKDVDKLKQNTFQIVEDVKDHATAHVDEAKKQVTDRIDFLRNRFNDHPFAVLGIGLAVGFLLGLRHRRS